MEIMDKEDTKKGQYAYICDNEITFNIGRSLGILLIFLFMGSSQTTALRYIPLLVGTISLVALWPLWPLVRRVDSHH